MTVTLYKFFTPYTTVKHAVPMLSCEMLSLLLLVGLAHAVTPPTYKTLVGPPNEFDQLSTYSPDETIRSKGCAVRPKNGQNMASNGIWEGGVPVDSWPFTVTVCTQLPDMIKMSFALDNSPINYCYEKTVEVNVNSGVPYPCRNFQFCNGTKTGALTIQLTCDANTCPEGTFKAYVEVTFPSSQHLLVTEIATRNPIIGEPVTITGSLQDTSGANINPIKIISAIMDIILPDGGIISKAMEILKDGSILGKFLPFLKNSNTDYSGLVDTVFDVIVKVTGMSEDDVKTYRTAANFLVPTLQHLFTSGSVSVGSMYTHPETNSQMVQFKVPVSVLQQSKDNNYRYYTQVWGTSHNGTAVPLCWMSGLVDIELDGNSTDEKYVEGHFNMEMDTKWMVAGEALFPVHLRNFSVDETVGFVELQNSDILEVKHDPSLLDWRPNMSPEEVKITEDMTEGYNPYRHKHTEATNGKLMLVHGYCSASNAFPTDQFSDYVVFEDFEQARPVDEFATRIDEFAKSQGVDAYSIVAHSQGGMAALHLLTYYNSGLDRVQVSNFYTCHTMLLLVTLQNGGRRIQTVGTGWEGTPLMGELATIAEVFGFGCGKVADLSPDVASRWLSKIPRNKQMEVYYYTTENVSQNCHF